MSILSDLKPTKKQRVINLVQEAGIDVEDWTKFRGGKKRAAVNPKYCYEWSFIKPSELVVLSCWYDEMYLRGGELVMDLWMRGWAESNARKGGKPVWSKRAWKFDEALQTALRDKLPIRVIVCDGKKRRADDPAALASIVTSRQLDPARWAITSYDYKTGKGRLTRGAQPHISNTLGISSAEIRAVFVQIAKLTTERLKRDLRVSGLLAPRDRRAQVVNSNGYAISIGRLGRAISVEIWLDHCAGLPTPRLWVGFSSPSRKAIDQVSRLSVLAAMAKRSLRISSSQVTTEPYFHITNGLRPDAFTRLVREDYRPHYLGVYYAYEWPFSDSMIKTLSDEAAAFVATVCEAYWDAVARARGRHRWAQADPAVEKAAIRHVTRYLAESGYLVRSREDEPVGYDLHATRGMEELHIEVKGCGGDNPRFFVSRNEFAKGKRDAQWRLAVITRALRRPRPPKLLTHAEMSRRFDLEPTQWEGRARL
jgi:hypothetical protein